MASAMPKNPSFSSRKLVYALDGGVQRECTWTENRRFLCGIQSLFPAWSLTPHPAPTSAVSAQRTEMRDAAEYITGTKIAFQSKGGHPQTEPAQA